MYDYEMCDFFILAHYTYRIDHKRAVDTVFGEFSFRAC